MTFDQPIDRAGTHCSKWDMMQPLYGLSPQDGLAMWVADMEFRPPAVVQQALQRMLDHGVYGYFGDDTAYLEARSAGGCRPATAGTSRPNGSSPRTAW
jgi:cysteine-S-conjugate beta-lyase